MEGNYAWDIAILKLEKPFTLSALLIPICLDIGTVTERTALEVGNYGKVPGFGRTSQGASSFLLQTISVPYIPLQQCKSSSLASESEKFITTDKFCAGYTNGNRDICSF